MHIIAAKAVAFKEALQPDFKLYAQQIVANAKVLAEAMPVRGLSASSPAAPTRTSCSSTSSRRAFSAAKPKHALGEAGITVNKNAIPYDTNPPLKPSGIRIGTPALTTRGMKEAEMRTIANGSPRRSSTAAIPRPSSKIRGQVLELAEQFPLYGWLRHPAGVVTQLTG